MKTSLCSATSSSIVRFHCITQRARPFTIVTDKDIPVATSSSIVRCQCIPQRARPFTIVDVDMKTSLCSATSSSIVRFQLYSSKSTSIHYCRRGHEDIPVLSYIFEYREIPAVFLKSTPIHYCRRGHEDISVLSYIFEYREILAVLLKARPFSIVDVDMKTSLCSATSSSIVRFQLYSSKSTSIHYCRRGHEDISVLSYIFEYREILAVLLKARPFSIVDVDMKTSLCSATSSSILRLLAVLLKARPFSIVDVDMKTSLCSATSSNISVLSYIFEYREILAVLLKARPFSIVDVDMKTSLCSATSSSIVRFQLYSSKSTSIHYCRRGHEDISVLSYILKGVDAAAISSSHCRHFVVMKYEFVERLDFCKNF
ncbi:hypothetical protein J6590_083289 [Homalodisca vitripennis]|nr:hypothetical protein J6590_083289 [Homalodisca vitripennis]